MHRAIELAERILETLVDFGTLSFLFYTLQYFWGYIISKVQKESIDILSRYDEAIKSFMSIISSIHLPLQKITMAALDAKQLTSLHNHHIWYDLLSA